MNSLQFAWVNLLSRPVRYLLLMGATVVAFMLHGLAFGIVEGLRLASASRGISIQPLLPLVAMGISAAGMLLILLLTTNAMTHSVRGRMQQLGLMKALGFSHRRILALLAAEASLPSLAGSALGLAGAEWLFSLMSMMLPALAAFPAPVLTAPVVAVALLLALLVAVIGTVIPARHLARKDVSVLMRGTAPTPQAMPLSGRAQDGAGGTARHDVSRPAGQRASTLDLRLLGQIAVATRIGLLTLPSRLKGVLLILGGVGATVFVLLFVLSAGEGIRVGLLDSGDPSRVILRSTAGGRTPDDLDALVAESRGIARAPDGSPLIDTQESIGLVGLAKKKADGREGYTLLVGVGPHWPEMTPTFKLLSGRMPRRGTGEVIAGALASEMFVNLESDVSRVLRRPTRVVGTFETGGWWDGYLVGDVTDVGAVSSGRRSLGLGNAGSRSVLIRLISPATFEEFRSDAIAVLPGSVTVVRETDHYRERWRRIPKHLVAMAFIFAGLIGTGAALGIAMVMDSALDERRREVATLQILGFDRIAVAASVLIEALFLSVLGGILGMALVWLFFDGSLNNAAGAIFLTTVDFPLLCLTVICGIVIALAGSMTLTLRIMRQSALVGLRELF